MSPGVRAEDEVAFLDEEDAGPRVAGVVVQRGDDVAEDVVRVAAGLEDALDRVECAR